MEKVMERTMDGSPSLRSDEALAGSEVARGSKVKSAKQRKGKCDEDGVESRVRSLAKTKEREIESAIRRRDWLKRLRDVCISQGELPRWRQ